MSSAIARQTPGSLADSEHSTTVPAPLDKDDVISRSTNFFAVLERLGLHRASWLDYVLDRTLDASTWLTAFSHNRKARWLGLEAHPQARVNSNNAFEHPNALPMEMLVYGVNQRYYHPRDLFTREVAEKSFSNFVHDDQGRLYIARLANSERHSFLLEASQRCPALLYSADSPLLPVYDVLPYSVQDNLMVYIWQPPPWPLSRPLVVGQEKRMELRRILERARDIFSNLAALHDRGASLDRPSFSKNWTESIYTDEGGPWLVPAYLSRSPQHGCSEGKLARMSHWHEKLPSPPPTAWPISPLKGHDLPNTLPWSQTAAYYDPRVEGPRTVSAAPALELADVDPALPSSQYLYGVQDVSWQEAAATERRAQWPDNGPYSWIQTLSRTVTPDSRYHADLIVAAEEVCVDLCIGRWRSANGHIKILESQHASNSYESWHHVPAAFLPKASSSDDGHSRLFTTCFKVCRACVRPHCRG